MVPLYTPAVAAPHCAALHFGLECLGGARRLMFEKTRSHSLRTLPFLSRVLCSIGFRSALLVRNMATHRVAVADVASGIFQQQLVMQCL